MSYSTSLGRFLERDPIGYSEDGMNLYEAYGSNPVTRVDPMGLESELPAGVSLPSNDSIVGNVRNRLLDLIEGERKQLLVDLAKAPADILKQNLDDLMRRQDNYECVVTVKSVVYLGTVERSQDFIVQRAMPKGPPSKNRVTTTAVFDRFSVVAHLKCTCPIEEKDYSWETEVRRGDARVEEHGPWQGPLPPPSVKNVFSPQDPIAVPFPTDPITVKK